MRGAQIECLDQRRKAIGIVRQAEARRNVLRATGSRLVPRDHGEIAAQRRDLRPPEPAVGGGAVGEHERRALAGELVGDLHPVRLDELHCRTLSEGPCGGSRGVAWIAAGGQHSDHPVARCARDGRRRGQGLQRRHAAMLSGSVRAEQPGPATVEPYRGEGV